MEPAPSSMRDTISSTALGSETSATAVTPPQAFATSSSSGDGSRSFTATVAPSAASLSAVARPIPCAAPVTSATVPPSTFASLIVRSPPTSNHGPRVRGEDLSTEVVALLDQEEHGLGDLLGAHEPAQRQGLEEQGIPPQRVRREERGVCRARGDGVHPYPPARDLG